MFTSYRIIDMVRNRISSEHVVASDTEVARAMGVSRAAVSAYKTGRDVMTPETFARANALLKLTELDVATITVDLLIERARTPNEKAILGSLQAIARYARLWAKNRAASILLLGCLIGAGAGPALSNTSAPATASADPQLYIMSNPRRGRKLMAWLKKKLCGPLPRPPWNSGIGVSRPRPSQHWPAYT